MANRARVGVAAFLVAALLGAAIVGVMVFRSVSVLSIDDNGARSTFEEARMRVASTTPLVPPPVRPSRTPWRNRTR